jgi:uncharacterized protein YjbI with pentapeptide repeats
MQKFAAHKASFRKAVFTDVNMQAADFTQSDLSSAKFNTVAFSGATFTDALLPANAPTEILMYALSREASASE